MRGLFIRFRICLSSGGCAICFMRDRDLAWIGSSE